jgi:hypothetical protein
MLVFGVAPSAGSFMPSLRVRPAPTFAGHPILLVTAHADPFTKYLGAILTAEGFNGFGESDISQMDSAKLAPYSTVVLAETPLSGEQATRLSRWVNNGGVLIAMRPDSRLRSLFGLGQNTGTMAEGYLRLDPILAPSRGITRSTLQFHGQADLYAPGKATSVAILSVTRDGGKAEKSPAVTLRSVGARGGTAVAFTFDVARSIMYTRQGNPAWSGQNRDGHSQRRPDDLFYPDYVDMERIAIPQADELQRLLSNLIVSLGASRVPAPRFWYLPRGLYAAVLMAGDDHGTRDGTQRLFNMLIGASARGCVVDAWQCERATSWIYDNVPMRDSAAKAYVAMGFELGAHVRARVDQTTECPDWTPPTLEAAMTRDLNAFHTRFPSLPVQRTLRVHCVVWSDWSTMPKVEGAHGIKLDMNYYFYPPAWVRQRQGYMTGSALPMPYADRDGSLLDVYQAPSHIVNENGREQRATIDVMFRHATGPEGYVGIIGVHVDYTDAIARQVLNAAQARGIPLVSAAQVLSWIEARDASRYSQVKWDRSSLVFMISAPPAARYLVGTLPLLSRGRDLISLTFDGIDVPFTARRFKGLDYAFFAARPGAYRAKYR